MIRLRRKARHRRRGTVLLFTLGILALIVVFILTLFQLATHETRGAGSTEVQSRLKLVADSATALVEAQINQASTQPGQAWISQPGLVRTFAVGSRRSVASYKLYSSLQNIDQSGQLDFLTQEVPTDWNSETKSNQYVDLNQPLVAGGFFSSAIYPIFDPAVEQEVEGVRVDAGHGPEMPVQWIYQMQDGTMGAASLATTTNPIVARVAYWTDDETSKVNLNTAGVGTVWRSPHANTIQDQASAENRPTLQQVWCAAGHPATTSLAPLLVGWSGDISGTNLLELTPRYGSTKRAFYSSVEDALFQPMALSGGVLRTAQAGFSPERARRARFVATVRSSAPETTLAGDPRVALWPTSSGQGTNQLTIWDQAVQKATSLNGVPYYFTRNNPDNGTDDMQIPRNQVLYQELITRGGRDSPGQTAGANFAQKYAGAKWPQIVLECVDFIRGLNAIDPQTAPFQSFAPGDATGLGRGFIAPLTTRQNGLNLRGIGRCPTLWSLTLVLYASGYGFDDIPGVIDFETMTDAQAQAAWQENFVTPARLAHVNRVVVRAFLVPSTYQPGCGFPETFPSCQMQISGLDALGVAGQSSFGFPTTAISHALGLAAKSPAATRSWGGWEGPLVWQAEAQYPTQNYPFCGTQPITLFVQNGLWTFSGATGLVVKFLNRNGVVLQTESVDLPGFNIAMISRTRPRPNNEFEGELGSQGQTVPGWYYMKFAHRLAVANDLSARVNLVQPGDVVRSVGVNTDGRLVSALAQVPNTFFAMHSGYLSGQAASPANSITTSATSPPTGSHEYRLNFADGTAAPYSSGTTALVAHANYGATPPLVAPLGLNGFADPRAGLGDFDTGPGLSGDGALINLPDAGTSQAGSAYFSWQSSRPTGSPTTRVANGLVPSAVIFGSLPSGIDPANPSASTPWQTLLFCPNPVVGLSVHPGASNPPDHLLLDQFWMPIVQPWPISQRFVTAGKVNLNVGIAPFTWLHRETALRAVLSNVQIPALAVTSASVYKLNTPSLNLIDQPIDVDATVQEWVKSDAYLSESEVCTLPLVPQGMAVGDLSNFWSGPLGGGALTGDNLREEPYGELLLRLTTRSNTYVVHIWAQTLKKLGSGSPPNEWREGTDLITGEWRGSYEIERYLDASAAAPASGEKLGPYHFRVVSTARFGP